MTKLVDLVYQGEIEQALQSAERLNPQEIYNQLFRDDERHLEEYGPCDEFLRHWYPRLPTAYLRAEAADLFAETYLTELAPAPNSEHIGANWRTESLRDLITEMSKAMLGDLVNRWEKTPEHPLPAEYAEKWRAAGKILAELDLPPAVPLINPDPPEHHRTTVAAG